MRWIRTAWSEKAHAVLSKMDRTICNIPVTEAVAIVSPQMADQCGSCDYAWREIGREAETKAVGAFYTPRFGIEDWEAQS